METVFLVLAVLIFAAQVVLILRTQKTSALDVNALNAQLELTVQKQLFELRQTLSDKIHAGQADSIARLETQMKEEREAREKSMMGFQGNLTQNLIESRKEQRDVLSNSTRDMEFKFKNLQELVNQSLTNISQEVQKKLDKNLEDGATQFQKVQETLVGAQRQLEGLNVVGESVKELNNVLNLPHLRGKIIGEGNLERLLADFLPVGFYEMQYLIEGKQVDAVIKFPHLNLVLPIDSKFSMEQVSELYEHGRDAESLKIARKKFAEILKQNAKDIRTKYIKPKLGTTDYALIYLPSETLYMEAVRDTQLWSTLADCKVYPVSPNTLAITINSIGKSLQYYEMAKGVQKTIQQLEKAKDHLYDFKNRFDDIGEKLNKAQDSFSKAGTHFTNYSNSVERLSGHAEIGLLKAVEPVPIRPA